jgi:2-dehydro-3-deoxyphosphogluconate aldolase/(4S)-4-hydroxy-2-oxoglutarate aldolase
MNQVLERIGKIGLVPVVKIDDAKDAVPLGRALIEGGLPIAEITFRTAAAAEAIKKTKAEFPQMLVGAGTVLTIDQVKASVESGAEFIVSPGLNPKVVEYCVSNSIPITPGCSSPTDIEAALEFGLEVVKFFPAEASGGLAALKAMSAPYGMIKFMPTGGIDPSNIGNYLAFNKILACGGSWMVKDEWIKAGNFAEIKRVTAEAVKIVQGFDIAHIGINDDSGAAGEIAAKFGSIFGMPVKEGNSSYFAGSILEVLKARGLGKNGHIAIKARNIDRAVYFLQNNGVEIDRSTAKNDAAGKLTAVYLKEEIGGFAVHLVQG